MTEGDFLGKKRGHVSAQELRVEQVPKPTRRNQADQVKEKIKRSG